MAAQAAIFAISLLVFTGLAGCNQDSSPAFSPPRELHAIYASNGRDVMIDVTFVPQALDRDGAMRSAWSLRVGGTEGREILIDSTYHVVRETTKCTHYDPCDNAFISWARSGTYDAFGFGLPLLVHGNELTLDLPTGPLVIPVLVKSGKHTTITVPAIDRADLGIHFPPRSFTYARDLLPLEIMWAGEDPQTFTAVSMDAGSSLPPADRWSMAVLSPQVPSGALLYDEEDVDGFGKNETPRMAIDAWLQNEAEAHAQFAKGCLYSYGVTLSENQSDPLIPVLPQMEKIHTHFASILLDGALISWDFRTMQDGIGTWRYESGTQRGGQQNVDFECPTSAPRVSPSGNLGKFLALARAIPVSHQREEFFQVTTEPQFGRGDSSRVVYALDYTPKSVDLESGFVSYAPYKIGWETQTGTLLFVFCSPADLQMLGSALL